MTPLVYKAGKQFVCELLDMGFEEVTDSMYPDHYERLLKSECYSPHSVKRAFKRDKVIVRLDYIRIYIDYKNGSTNTTLWSGIEIKEEDLVSCICTPRTVLSNRKIK